MARPRSHLLTTASANSRPELCTFSTVACSDPSLKYTPRRFVSQRRRGQNSKKPTGVGVEMSNSSKGLSGLLNSDKKSEPRKSEI